MSIIIPFCQLFEIFNDCQNKPYRKHYTSYYKADIQNCINDFDKYDKNIITHNSFYLEVCLKFNTIKLKWQVYLTIDLILMVIFQQ